MRRSIRQREHNLGRQEAVLTLRLRGKTITAARAGISHEGLFHVEMKKGTQAFKLQMRQYQSAFKCNMLIKASVSDFSFGGGGPGGLACSKVKCGLLSN